MGTDEGTGPPQGEEQLTGGNTSVVVRVGDTVRREAGPWTPAVHSLLQHFERVGFDGAPRVIGSDDRGREVLGYVAGRVGTFAPHRLDEAFTTGALCQRIGSWLRAMHDAQVDFEPDPSLPWRMHAGRRLAADEVVVHNDAAPYNTVLRPDGGLTVIDWDFASPGDRVDDLAFTLWSWLPLWSDRMVVQEQFRDASLTTAARKYAAVLEGYDVSEDQHSRLPSAITSRMNEHADGVERLAAGDPAFVRLAADGVAENARRDARWFSSVAQLVAGG